MQSVPGTVDKKKEVIATMFDGIARRYDFLNHFLSFGIDVYWRNQALSKLRDLQPRHILDVATGTGDFAFQALRLKPDKITGIDISPGMLEVGKAKVTRRKMENTIDLMQGDSENIPFPDNTFDAVTVAFGVRNFENLERGLAEMFRVTRPGGKAVILEFSNPVGFPVKQLYRFYSSALMPLVGRIVSRHSKAYSYLPQSVREFPEGEVFLRAMQSAGFGMLKHFPLTSGIASVYTGEK